MDYIIAGDNIFLVIHSRDFLHLEELMLNALCSGFLTAWYTSMYVFKSQIFWGSFTLIACSAFSFVSFTREVKYYDWDHKKAGYFRWSFLHDWVCVTFCVRIRLLPDVYSQMGLPSVENRRNSTHCNSWAPSSPFQPAQPQFLCVFRRWHFECK